MILIEKDEHELRQYMRPFVLGGEGAFFWVEWRKCGVIHIQLRSDGEAVENCPRLQRVPLALGTGKRSFPGEAKHALVLLTRQKCELGKR